jgi:hypothetical protein
MLHDLYLLSCYFEPTQAVLYEDDLNRRYGVDAVRDAVRAGFVELYCAPCAKSPGKFFCRLSQRGIGQIESALV